jgi:hypothetical protein
MASMRHEFRHRYRHPETFVVPTGHFPQLRKTTPNSAIPVERVDPWFPILRSPPQIGCTDFGDQQ